MYWKKTQKLKLQKKIRIKSDCDNSKTQIVTKIKNSNCDKTQWLKVWQNKQKIKLWPKSNVQIATKLQNSHCDNRKAQILTEMELWLNLTEKNCEQITIWQN